MAHGAVLSHFSLIMLGVSDKFHFGDADNFQFGDWHSFNFGV